MLIECELGAWGQPNTLYSMPTPHTHTPSILTDEVIFLKKFCVVVHFKPSRTCDDLENSPNSAASHNVHQSGIGAQPPRSNPRCKALSLPCQAIVSHFNDVHNNIKITSSTMWYPTATNRWSRASQCGPGSWPYTVRITLTIFPTQRLSPNYQNSHPKNQFPKIYISPPSKKTFLRLFSFPTFSISLLKLFSQPNNNNNNKLKTIISTHPFLSIVIIIIIPTINISSPKQQNVNCR